MAVVVIFDSGGKAKVWPPCVVVKPGDEIVFKCVNTSATVFLPNPDIFAMPAPLPAVEMPAVAATMELSGNRGVGKMKVKGTTTTSPSGKTTYSPDSPAAGLYPYSVYCKRANDFAEGNSSPVIIIEPPDPLGVWPDFCLSMPQPTGPADQAVT